MAGPNRRGDRSGEGIPRPEAVSLLPGRGRWIAFGTEEVLGLFASTRKNAAGQNRPRSFAFTFPVSPSADSGVDYSVFDYGVNSGIGRSGKVLRRAVGLPDNSLTHGVTLRVCGDLSGVRDRSSI